MSAVTYNKYPWTTSLAVSFLEPLVSTVNTADIGIAMRRLGSFSAIPARLSLTVTGARNKITLSSVLVILIGPSVRTRCGRVGSATQMGVQADAVRNDPERRETDVCAKGLHMPCSFVTVPQSTTPRLQQPRI